MHYSNIFFTNIIFSKRTKVNPSSNISRYWLGRDFQRQLAAAHRRTRRLTDTRSVGQQSWRLSVLARGGMFFSGNIFQCKIETETELVWVLNYLQVAASKAMCICMENNRAVMRLFHEDDDSDETPITNPVALVPNISSVLMKICPALEFIWLMSWIGVHMESYDDDFGTLVKESRRSALLNNLSLAQ